MLFFVLFLLPIFCFGQLDSLLLAAKNLSDGEEKMDTWLEIANILRDYDPESCLLYCDSIEKQATQTNNTERISKSIYLRSSALYMKGRSIDALPYGLTALKLAKESQDTQQLIARHNNLGMIYSELEFFEKSSKHLLACAELSAASGGFYYAAVSYYNLSTLFFDLDNMAKAKEYIQLSIKILEDNNNYSIHCILLNALASVIENEEEEERLIQEAINYCYENNTPYYLIPIYNNLGTEFQDDKNYTEAKKNYRLSLNYALEYDNIEFVVHAGGNLGDIFMLQNHLDSAMHYSLMALKLAEENGYLSNQQLLYNQLGEIYGKKQDFKKAYFYSQKAFEIRDSIYESDIEQQLQINADQFQLERKEKQLAEQDLALARAQNSKNRLTIWGILSLSLIIAFYQWYLFKQQKRKQAADLKLSLEQAESLRLREVDKMKTNFFTNISHELRTPLTLILSPIADVIPEINSKPIRGKLEIVQRNGERLLNLVNEIMDLSKVEIGKLESHQSEVNLIPLIKRIFSSFESLAAIRRLKYELKLDINKVNVLLDRDKFEKIIHNLLSNAIKFTKTGGKINMYVSNNDEYYFFEIKDNGQGIAVEDQLHVFDRYYQAQNSQQALQGGTGIGLALAKELAQLLGGDIEMVSQLNKGSCFKLILPLKEIQITKKEKINKEELRQATRFTPSYAPISIKNHKPKILIV